MTTTESETTESSRYGESTGTAENLQESTRHDSIKEGTRETAAKESPAQSGEDNAGGSIKEVEQESSAQEHSKA